MLLPGSGAVAVFNEAADAHHRHQVQFYSDDSMFFESTTRFIADALMAANAAISLEKFGNDVVKLHNVDILCAYPLPHGQEDDHALKSICAEHTAVYWR